MRIIGKPLHQTDNKSSYRNKYACTRNGQCCGRTEASEGDHSNLRTIGFAIGFVLMYAVVGVNGFIDVIIAAEYPDAAGYVPCTVSCLFKRGHNPVATIKSLCSSTSVFSSKEPSSHFCLTLMVATAWVLSVSSTLFTSKSAIVPPFPVTK